MAHVLAQRDRLTFYDRLTKIKTNKGVRRVHPLRDRRESGETSSAK